ncbi:methylenetetrahydrofolate reductase [bacterium]|nr:methylenetetrahydrofolate reductase [bacterium]
MNLIELVPRDPDGLIEEARLLLNRFPALSGVNIPDVTRLPHRSHSVAEKAAASGILAIPHIRCVDRSIADSIALVSRLVAGGVRQVLIVSGDKNPKQETVYDVTPPDLIRELRVQFAGLEIYAGIDPYRNNLIDELRYADKKRAAGANGFFTQPFFDIHHAMYFSRILGQSHLFLGISPVTTSNSKTYWENVNKAVFPASFDLSMEWNARVAKDIISFAQESGNHVYLMPIKVDAAAYLDQVLTR